MRHLLFLSLAIFCIAVNTANAQQPIKKTDYTTLWKAVDEADTKGLPQTALKTVNEIYTKAKIDNNNAQLVRAIIYIIRYTNYREEDGTLKSIARLKKEISTAIFPVKPMLQTMVAEMYWNYYESNRYRFSERTDTKDFNNDSIDTWSLKKIVTEVIKNYKLSLANPSQLQKVKIDIYDEVLIKGNSKGRSYRPTLYDLLAHRAADFFMNDEASITRPAYAFTLNSPEYLSEANEFVNISISSKDTLSFHLYALKILQDITRFHLSDAKPDALLDVELKRLQFVNRNLILTNKQDLYLQILEKIEAKYNTSPVSTIFSNEIGQIWDQRGRLYKPLQSDDHKWDLKKAFDIYQNAIARFPQAYGAILCFNQQQELLRKDISAKIEKVNIPNQPFRAFIQYKNIKTLYWRAIPVTRKEVKTERNRWIDNYEVNKEDNFLEYFLPKPFIASGKLSIPCDSDLQMHATEVKIDGLPTGDYMLLFSPNEKFTLNNNNLGYAFTEISNLSWIQRNCDNGSTDGYILNRTTGEPVPGSIVYTFCKKYDIKTNHYLTIPTDTIIADSLGYVNIPFKKYGRNYDNSYSIIISWKKDVYNAQDIDENEYSQEGKIWQQKYSKPQGYTSTLFFLDRSIYRPGQTIYYKGLYYKNDNESPEILPNKQLTLTFYNVNSEVVASSYVTTNDFGTFNGTFTTPTKGLMGMMYLQVNDDEGSRTYFSVEEYKRPKFEVTMEKVKGSFRLGDSIKITGKAIAYSGANIDGAKVKYRVVREARFPYWWWCWYGYYPSSPQVAITDCDSKTDNDGKFNITFKALPDESIDPSSDPTFSYTLFADVTDINGETHSTQTSVDVAYKSLLVKVNARNIDLSKPDTSLLKFTITTTNFAGEFEPAKGNISIWKLRTPSQAYKKRYWEQPDQQSLSHEEFRKYFPNDPYADENNFYKWENENEVLHASFNTQNDKKLVLADYKNWLPGKYKLEISGMDNYGQNVKDIVYFDVTQSASDKPVLPDIQRLEVLNPTCEPGEKATIIAGSSEKIYALLEAEHNGKIIEKRVIKLDNSTDKIEIPILEQYRGNLAVHYSFVKNNRVYIQTQTIYVPFTNKQLDIKFETFRNKLQPGEKEQWKLKISGNKSDKILAEMVASMYDASLDAFKPHNWYANFYNALYPRLQWQCQFGFEPIQFRQNDRNWNTLKYKTYVGIEYDRFEFLNTYTNYELYSNANAVNATMELKTMDDEAPSRKMKSARATVGFVAPVIVDNDKEEAVFKKSESVAGNINPNEIPGSKNAKTDFSDVKIRKNFNETAFYYPNLQTNENGEIIINFTIPEALTKWKMQGFAHTKELQSGLITNELVTQKDLMVVPNQPRFFRENDKMFFSVKITSLSDSSLSGDARLEFFDALTMQPVNDKLKNTNATQPFQLKSKQSTNLEWNIEIPEGLQAITYRIVAKAGNFSDGEEMALPVVTNRMLVTETLPLPIRGKQTKKFTLDKLVNNTSPTLRNQRFTLEFTANPAWYAIQALPYLMEYPYECTEQTFSRFYANSIASHIANSNPKIKQVFDTWSTLQPDALLSNLEKNQELKSALLEETPWVLNAKDENQRKRNVALLFDLNRMANEQEQALLKIQKAQTGNGGFSWFPGLPDDRYITQHIVAGIGHLDVMGVKSVRSDATTWEMTTKAIGYIDNKINDTYQYLKAEAKKGRVKLDDNHIGYTEIHYLYARSYFRDVTISSNNKEAFNYFLGQAKKYWLKNSIYMQGMIALALHRYNDNTVPILITNSLKEKSLHSEEMGMYWKNDIGYYWYQAPIETQALMVEVFDEVAKDNQSVEDLKVWLLKQKQTQDWRTTRATTEACYALLRRGSDLLTNENQVEIKVGNETIDPTTRPDIKTEAGTGYFKTAWTASEIKKEMGNITVTKKDEGVSWGAVYWQYFEQLDKITPAETPLKLKKQLFLQQNTDRGPVIVPVTDTTSLKLGDLIKVRIELRVDRDMEYIHLKDMRAAGFEPTETISTYKYQDGLYYYQSTRDLSTNFFIGWLSKGTYVFEYPLRVSQKGNFSNGITTIQCMYAPEFSSHSEGIRVTVGN
jgi:uncharacterized protein YfaS (alpha-2-macroglobulin family)